MKIIYIDADACPVKGEIYKVAQRYQFEVRVVTNTPVQIPKSETVKLVLVQSGLDAADDWIADQATEGDLVITEDIPLASRCLENKAKVIGTRGNVFDETSIGEAMASRELYSQLRDQGLLTGGPSPFRQKDRSNFLQKIDQTIHQILKEIKRIQPSKENQG